MFTKWDDGVKGSLSHHRVVKYEFAGLKCVVKSECVAYLDSSVIEADAGDSHQVKDSSTTSFAGSTLKSQGAHVSQTKTVKIETREIYNQ